MADKPLYGSELICAIQEDLDANGQQVPVPLYAETAYGLPYRLVVELPDRALRDLGVVTISDGNVGASAETSTIYNGTTALTPKFKVIDHATSGDNEIVAAVTAKKIRVIAGLLISAGTVTVRFESGASGTALTGQMSLVANTGFQIPYCPVGNFETAAGVALNLELSGNVSADGWIVYLEV